MKSLFPILKFSLLCFFLLDIGGESTRPGYTTISAGEEIERVIPALEAVKTRFNIPISPDSAASPDDQ